MAVTFATETGGSSGGCEELVDLPGKQQHCQENISFRQRPQKRGRAGLEREDTCSETLSSARVQDLTRLAQRGGEADRAAQDKASAGNQTKRWHTGGRDGKVQGCSEASCWLSPLSTGQWQSHSQSKSNHTNSHKALL